MATAKPAKSGRVRCDVCAVDYAPTRICAHLAQAKRNWEIRAKRERDAHSLRFPSGDPVLRYLEERRRSLPDDHDLFVFEAVFDFHQANPHVWEELARMMEEVLFEEGTLGEEGEYGFPCAWNYVRWNMRKRVSKVGRWRMNNNFSPYYSRLLQIIYPDRFLDAWVTRRTHSRGRRHPDAHADYELGWTRAEPEAEQDRPTVPDLVSVPQARPKSTPSLLAVVPAKLTEDEWRVLVRQQDEE
jgi:hypothetical protein